MDARELKSGGGLCDLQQRAALTTPGEFEPAGSLANTHVLMTQKAGSSSGRERACLRRVTVSLLAPGGARRRWIIQQPDRAFSFGATAVPIRHKHGAVRTEVRELAIIPERNRCSSPSRSKRLWLA